MAPDWVFHMDTQMILEGPITKQTNKLNKKGNIQDIQLNSTSISLITMQL